MDHPSPKVLHDDQKYTYTHIQVSMENDDHHVACIINYISRGELVISDNNGYLA